MSRRQLRATETRAEMEARNSMTSHGVINYDLWLYSGDSSGRAFGPATDRHIKVQGDGHATSHTSFAAAPIEEEPAVRVARAAGLTPRETDVFHRQLAKVSNPEIARDLGLSLRQVERAVTSLRKKVREYEKAARMEADE